MEPTLAASRQVRSWTRAALLLERGRPIETAIATKTVENTADLVAATARHRVAEVLAAQAVGLALPLELRKELDAVASVNRRIVMLQALEITQIHEALCADGVEPMVIKGLPLAVQTTGDLAARGPGDLDLLVAPRQVQLAHRSLVSAGWVLRPEAPVEPAPWAWRYLARTFYSLSYQGPGTSIDLHWRLDPSIDGLPGFDQVWERRELVDLAGIAIPTLGRRDALGHSCLHASKDRWRSLRSIVDIHRLAGDPLVWKQFGPTGELRRLEAASLAVARAQLGLPPGVPPQVLARIDRIPPRTLRRAERNQDRPADAAIPVPGIDSARSLRYVAGASASAGNLLNAAVAALIPVDAVIDVTSRRAATGIPVAFGHRLRQMAGRIGAWARRYPRATP